MLSKIARSALDFVFPIHCAGCGRDGGILCDECVGGLEHLTRPYCQICASPSISGLCRWCSESPRGFDSLRAPYQFDGAIREAIHRLKYKGERASAPVLSGLLAEYVERERPSLDIVVPVPLHPQRLRSRGFNQSALLACEVANRLDLPVQEDLVRRATNSLPQVDTKTREERRSNVADGFECGSDASGLRVLLIDDVATTGSTLSECAMALKESGVASVHAMTLARETIQPFDS